MAETTVRMEFSRGFDGMLMAQNGEARVGREEGALRPYDLLLGALGACYYSTFLDIAGKMRLEYERAEISLRGVKRDTVPTTLETVDMVFTIHGAAGEKGFERATQLAAKYCSVHETIAWVAEIRLEVLFEA